MAKDDKGKHDKPEKKQPAQAQAQPKPKKEAKAAPKAEAPARAEGPKLPVPPARLAIHYREKVVPDLMQKYGYKTVMQVPRIRKITINNPHHSSTRPRMGVKADKPVRLFRWSESPRNFIASGRQAGGLCSRDDHQYCFCWWTPLSVWFSGLLQL